MVWLHIDIIAISIPSKNGVYVVFKSNFLIVLIKLFIIRSNSKYLPTSKILSPRPFPAEKISYFDLMRWKIRFFTQCISSDTNKNTTYKWEVTFCEFAIVLFYPDNNIFIPIPSCDYQPVGNNLYKCPWQKYSIPV